MPDGSLPRAFPHRQHRGVSGEAATDGDGLRVRRRGRAGLVLLVVPEYFMAIVTNFDYSQILMELRGSIRSLMGAGGRERGSVDTGTPLC